MGKSLFQGLTPRSLSSSHTRSRKDGEAAGTGTVRVGSKELFQQPELASPFKKATGDRLLTLSVNPPRCRSRTPWPWWSRLSAIIVILLQPKQRQHGRWRVQRLQWQCCSIRGVGCRREKASCCCRGCRGYSYPSSFFCLFWFGF